MREKKKAYVKSCAIKPETNVLKTAGHADLIMASLLLKAAFVSNNRQALIDEAKSAFDNLGKAKAVAGN